MSAPVPPGAPRAARSTRFILAIDGLDGSGKSQLAARVAAELAREGVIVPLLGVDDFRRPVTWNQPGRDEADIYYADYYEYAWADRVLAAFLAGAPSAEVPVFDSRREARDGTRTIVFGDAPLAVLEGVFTQKVPAAAGALPAAMPSSPGSPGSVSHLIYLDTSPDEARRRILARDTARGRTPAEVTRRIDARYFPAQDRYHREHSPRERAALIIDNNDLSRPRIARGDESRLPAVVFRAIDRALSTSSPSTSSST